MDPTTQETKGRGLLEPWVGRVGQHSKTTPPKTKIKDRAGDTAQGVDRLPRKQEPEFKPSISKKEVLLLTGQL